MIGGLIVDQIQTIIDSDQSCKASTAITKGDFEEGLARSQEMITFIADIWGLVVSKTPYHTQEDPVDVFWKSLAFNTGDMEECDMTCSEMRESFESWHESLMMCHVHMQIGVRVRQGGLPLPSQAQVLEYLQDATPFLKWRPAIFEANRAIDAAFLEQMRAYVRQGMNTQSAFQAPSARFGVGRRYFASNNGYVGWVPRHAREGDRICAFYGSRYPFVVRACGDSWRLVGACFMYGLMNGGDIELPATDGESDEMIKLI